MRWDCASIRAQSLSSVISGDAQPERGDVEASMYFYVIRKFHIDGDSAKDSLRRGMANSFPHRIRAHAQTISHHEAAPTAKLSLPKPLPAKLLAAPEPDSGCSEGVRRILQRAHAIADALKHSAVNCEHLVLAMALDADGRSTIAKFEFDPEQTRATSIAAIVNHDPHADLLAGKASRTEAICAILNAATARSGQREAELRKISVDDVLHAILTVPAAADARKLIQGTGFSNPGDVMTVELRGLRKQIESDLGGLLQTVSSMSETTQTILRRLPRPAPIRSASPLLSWRSGASEASGNGTASNDNAGPARVRYVAAATALLLLGGVLGYLLHDRSGSLIRFVGWLLNSAV